MTRFAKQLATGAALGIAGSMLVATGPDSMLATASAAEPPFDLEMPVDPGATVWANGSHPSAGSVRSAIDLRMPDSASGRPDTRVRAAHSGKVEVYSGGCIVRINGPSGWSTEYAHLDSTSVTPGETVNAGDYIGLTGTPQETCGTGSGSHLHFSLLQNRSYVPIDGVSIGGYTPRASGGSYCGYWTRDSDGAEVVNARSCVTSPKLVNNQTSSGGGSRHVFDSQVTTTRDGTEWLLQMSKGGTLFIKHRSPGGSWSARTRVGTSSLYQHAVIAPLRDNRIFVLGLTKDGTAWQRIGGKGSPEGWGSGSRHGAVGAWSKIAVAAGDGGRVWLAGVTKSGKFITRHAMDGTGWSALNNHGSDGIWATPAIAVGGGRVQVGGLTNKGTLYTRSAYSGSGKWISSWSQNGTAGSHKDVALASDIDGQRWVAVIGKDGRMRSREAWEPWTTHGGATFDSVDIETEGDGVAMVAGLRSDNVVVTQRRKDADHWQPAATVANKSTWGKFDLGKNSDGTVRSYGVTEDGTGFSANHVKSRGWFLGARHDPVGNWK